MNENHLSHYPDLATLQAQQLVHDRAYSRDIMGMTHKGQLTHYTLHQAKYIGHLVGFNPRDVKFTFNDIVTNSYIVMLAMANALKLNLREEVQHRPAIAYPIRTPEALGLTLIKPQAEMAEALIDLKEPQPTLWSHICAQMPSARRECKAANARMSTATIAFCRILSGVNMGLSMDMDRLVANRLEKRARGNLFHPQNAAQQRLNSPE